MSNDDELKKEDERLRAENERLRSEKSVDRTAIKISGKGAVSVYGLGRFPVTLYKEQWLKLLDRKDEILGFIEEHSAELKTKS
jgi:hypothetical protein